MHAAGGLLSAGGHSALNMRSLADSIARHSEAELAEQLAEINGADAKLRVLVSGVLHTEDDAHDTAALIGC